MKCHSLALARHARSSPSLPASSDSSSPVSWHLREPVSECLQIAHTGCRSLALGMHSARGARSAARVLIDFFSTAQVRALVDARTNTGGLGHPDTQFALRMLEKLYTMMMARPSLIPPLRTQFTRAGIEWRRCQHAVRMAWPHKAPHHSGQAEP